MKALALRDLTHATQLIRALDGALPAPRGGYALYLLSEREDGGGDALCALTGCEPRGLLDAAAALLSDLRVHPRCGGAGGARAARATLTLPDESARSLWVQEVREARALPDLLPLLPWPPGAPRLPARAPLLFWHQDRAAAAALALSALQLGDDRVDYAVLSPDGAGQEGGQEGGPGRERGRGGEALLVRLSEPSHYLVQRAVDDPRVTVYYEHQRGVYVEWGYDPPLPERLAGAPRPEGAPLLFMTRRAPLRALPTPLWRDVYERLQLDLPLSADDAWRAAPAE
ncbi:MAG: hypothetical protein FJ138_17545, partial [Deltaproteobacteria bacterium]|nr:hypothetical protein [Deltaproteobacteria bacterium]